MALEVFSRDYSEVCKVIYPQPPYRSFFIKKRSGGLRLIEEPRRKVKLLQLQALKFLRSFAAKERPCVHGFMNGRSIVSNAKAHCERRPSFVLNIDIEDFFPSITFFRIRGLFQKTPFSFSFEVATVFAQLCTRSGKLPQGAPTSPYLSNLICRSLDRDLMALAKRHRCTYTRYADDMTFSFSVRDEKRLPVNICTFDDGIASVGAELRSVVGRHSFRLNEAKTRISSRHSRQEVTGLTINEFPNVRRKFVDSVRGALHAWELHGYAAADQDWQRRVEATAGKGLRDMAWPRQKRELHPPRLQDLLWGKLLYLRMVRSERDPLYNRLAERYNGLLAAAKLRDPRFQGASLPTHYEVHRSEHVAKAVYVVTWVADFQVPGNPQGETEVGGSQGTAFAYHRSDMLITCEHVLRCKLDSGGIGDIGTAAGAELKLFNFATGNWSTATVVARDMDLDLAVLRMDSSADGMRHFVRSPVLAKRDMRCYVIGFPNWSAGRDHNTERATVASLYGRKGLPKFEVSVTVRKGNSGGPVVSDNFELLGVAQEGATQETGNNEAMSVDHLDKWLHEIAVSDVFLQK